MADETSNSMSGENNGTSFMAGEVHGNVTFHSPRRRSVMAFGGVALGAVVLAAVFVAGTRFDDRPAPDAATTSTTPPPPSSAPPATTTTAVQAATTKPPSPVPQPPAPKPADDGPGYLLIAGNTGEVVDTTGITLDALLVARKAEGAYEADVQRSWVREFSSATPDLFRFRNARKNLCLETETGAAVRGEPMRLADCSWERTHQLWRAKNSGQAASAVSGECLGPGEASPPFGTSVVVTACQDGPAQRWQISR
ncbi:ricin-type beta-trefoil lectin domain protein [Lentzea sp. BCCO 10_0856]|uniref:Ricin-type beta-trefoil lectin domain protein n=1 Tax=Lentzea miocenica TaxID=3095431 RepID=A0ABU4SUN7_9PSEU|nr:ricin-type beta-trefoil lectin domain protein [Lentzea sp. BCCO 10_0856]MDX8029599.1 ricin-type beta-trefoil lectin domain protein [Lentzea sp. BCCO 10_0856]